jgi:hypothetical protein
VCQVSRQHLVQQEVAQQSLRDAGRGQAIDNTAGFDVEVSLSWKGQ